MMVFELRKLNPAIIFLILKDIELVRIVSFFNASHAVVKEVTVYLVYKQGSKSLPLNAIAITQFCGRRKSKKGML